MAKPRMIQGQFGAVSYDSGTIPPAQASPLATASVQFNESGAYMGIKRHNDKFLIPDQSTRPDIPIDASGLHFATFQYIDLRDLIEEKACMDDVVINVQRLKETPWPNLTYNLAPGNIEETFLVVLGDLGLDNQEPLTYLLWDFHKAGFQDFTPAEDQGGLPFEVLYRESRQYQQDPSQNFVSPDQVGSQAGPSGNAANAPTRFVGNFRLSSRTIGGYPDLLVGPGITVIRVWSMWAANRSVQGLNGAGPTDTVADEFTHLQSRLQCYIPALQFNIVGTQRKLTATETATYYSNILMHQG